MSYNNYPVPTRAAVPATVQANEAELYDLHLRMSLQGLNLKEAIVSCSFSPSTYYRWRQDYPSWVAAVQRQAKEDAIEIRREMEEQLARKRAAVEAEVQAIILENSQAIVQNILDIANDPQQPAKIQLAATRALREWLAEGFAHHMETEPPRQEVKIPSMTYNPHTQKITRDAITLPPGATVRIDTPEEPIEHCPTDDHAGQSET
jgi:hypothetical protein